MRRSLGALVLTLFVLLVSLGARFLLLRKRIAKVRTRRWLG